MTMSAETRASRLRNPTGRVRVVIDTDAANEIDDQFALAWALQSPDKIQIEAVLAEPYSFAHLREGLLEAAALIDSGAAPEQGESGLVDSFRGWVLGLKGSGVAQADIEFVDAAEGMERSYQEILRVYDLMGEDSTGMVFRGSPGYMASPTEPCESEAVDRLIELAMAPGDDPLYVMAIGAVTNVASAIVKEPRIMDHIVVLWTAGFPTWSPQLNTDSLNLVQDVAASRILFDSGVPLVYFPGYYMGAQLRLSLPEMETWVRGRGAIGDYLYHLYTNNPLHAQRGIQGHFGRTWVIWDMITLAWLLEPAWVPTGLVRTPTLDDDLGWVEVEGRDYLMREAHGIDRDAIFRDFFRKLNGGVE